MPREGRRSQVLGIIRQSHTALDDDQIAQAAKMNRVYVNVVCRQLASERLIVRAPGPEGKLVNMPERFRRRWVWQSAGLRHCADACADNSSVAFGFGIDQGGNGRIAA